MHAQLTVPKFQAALDALAPSAVSFDVFDTLLTRTVAHPDHLFLDCGEHLRGLGMFTGSNTDYRHFRVVAEKKARDRHPKQEPTFAEVHAVLKAMLGWSDSARAAAMECELKMETATLIPIPAAARCVALCRERKLRIFYLSDMYLPSAFISSQLARYGIALETEPVFVSCEAHASKHTGALFDLVREKFSLTPAAWLHVGDNENSDRTRPARRGIHTFYATNAHLSSIEKTYLPFSPATCGLASRIAAASRAARLTDAERNEDPALAALGAGLVGPIFASFAAWLFAQARARKITRFYFVSRDGQVMREIALRMQARMPEAAGIECRYLYGSRLAWHRASLNSFSPRHLEWILDPLPKVNFEIMAERLGVAPEGLRAALRIGAGLLEKEKWNEADIAHVKAKLTAAEDEILALLRATDREQLARRYLEEAGLTDGTPCAIVELGWKGRMLTSLIETLEITKDFHAFYLGLSGFDEDRPANLRLDSFLIEPEGMLTREGRGLRIAELLEVLAAADHATVLGYEQSGDRVEPVLKTGGVNTWATEDLQALRGAAYRFVEQLPETGLKMISRAVQEPDACKLLTHCLLGVLADFARDPEPSLAAVFSRCRFTEDASDSQPRPYITPLDARTARNFRGDLQQLWPQGTLAISKGTWRALATRGWSAALAFAWRRVRRVR